MLKKAFAFLRSMRFGLILMACVIICSIIGSVLPQNEAHSVYLSAWPALGGLMLTLELDHIFSAWYFIALLALLCLNLTLCSLTRVRRVQARCFTAESRALASPNAYQTTPEQRARLLAFLKNRRYREKQTPEAVVYSHGRLGYWGSFLTHLSILLVIILGAAVMHTARTDDYTVMPGESVTLDDGTVLAVEAFHITDDAGKLDYRSMIRITAPDGVTDEPVQIRVNEPHAFGGHKYYQQTYGTVGSVTILNQDTGGSDTFTLDAVSFLTADGVNGVWYEALYADYQIDADGGYTLVASTAGEYANPVYQVLLSSGGIQTPVLAFPGEALTVGNLQYTFNPPISYPGIRVKTTSQPLLGCLYASFALMVLGLWLCFFLTPAAIVIHEDGFAVNSPKPAGIMMMLEAEIGVCAPAAEKEKQTC